MVWVVNGAGEGAQPTREFTVYRSEPIFAKVVCKGGWPGQKHGSRKCFEKNNLGISWVDQGFGSLRAITEALTQ